MSKTRVLFVCIHNSARSQMAMALLNTYYGNQFEAESAGYEPGTLNPLAIDGMKEIGIDISNNPTNRVFDYFKQGKLYKYVITVCDEVNAERCPIFPGVNQMIHWSFSDPSTFDGTYEKKLQKTIEVRDKVKSQIDEWVHTL